MSNEVKAARERLRDLSDCWVDIENAPPEAVRDMWRCAKQDLAEHPADDDELIDEDFLRSVGADRRGRAILYGPGISLHIVSINRQFDGIEAHQDDNEILLVYHKDAAVTRGELRRLCRELCIDLKA